MQNKRLIPPLFLGVFAFALTLPVLCSRSDEMLAGPDYQKYFLPIHLFMQSQIREGRLPLWCPYIYCGVPFASNPQCMVFYPPVWLVAVMQVISVHKVLVVLHLFLAGLFMFVYLRSLGLCRLAAVCGSLPWMGGGYAMANARVGHMSMLFAMAWIPLAVLFLERGLQTRRLQFMALCGLVMGIQFLAGEPQTSYYTALLLGVYLFCRVVDGTGLNVRKLLLASRRWAVSMCVIALAASAISAVQLLQTAEFALISDRSDADFGFSTAQSLSPSQVAIFLFPWSMDFSGIATHDLRFEARLDWESAGYVGIATVCLALLSLGIRGDKILRIARVVAIVGIVLMLGSNTPMYHLLYDWLPGLRLFRSPPRAVVLLIWSICVMSAFQLNSMNNFPRNHASKTLRTVLAISLFAVIAVICAAWVTIGIDRLNIGFLYADETDRTPLSLLDPVLLRLLIFLAVALIWVCASFRLTSKHAASIASGIMVLDLLIPRPHFECVEFAPEKDERMRTLGVLHDEIESSGMPARVDLGSFVIGPNAAMITQVENVNGYWPLALKRFLDFIYAMRSDDVRHARYSLEDRLYGGPRAFPYRVLNVRFASPFREGDKQISIVRGKNPNPRAWVVDQIEVLTDDESILNRLKDPSFKPDRTAILEHPADLRPDGSGSPGNCTVKRVGCGELSIATNTTREGYLILSEIHYAGWRASIDGRETKLERADYLLTAMRLPAGQHAIRYWYEPASFRVGLIISLATLGLVVLLTARSSKRCFASRSREDDSVIG